MTKDTIIQLIGADPAETIEKIHEMAKERAKLKATYDYGIELRKIILAKCSETIREQYAVKGETISEARIGQLALVNKDYSEFLTKQRGVNEQFENADSNFWLEKSRFDLLLKYIELEKAKLYFEGQKSAEQP